MEVVTSDDRLVLKSSTSEMIQHSHKEYCMENRQKCSKIECLTIVILLLTAVFSYTISTTLLNLKTIITVVFLSATILRLIYKVHSESLLIIAPIGLQLTTTYITGHQTVFSLPWQSISDVVIVEVIHSQKVLDYLAIKTSQSELVVLFHKSAPRLRFLKIIFIELQQLLENHR